MKIFNVGLKKGQALSKVFMSLDITGGLVFEYMSVEPVVIQKVDVRVTLLAFPEDIDVEGMFTTLQSVDI